MEIDLAAGFAAEHVVDAWRETVAGTEALRLGFFYEDSEPAGRVPLADAPELRVSAEVPARWDAWLAADRAEPLALDGGPPWRATFWPGARKFIWTFHHALLDGRSIGAILHGFLARLAGEDPGALRLADSPSVGAEEIEAAEQFHRQEFAPLEAHEPEFPADAGSGPARVHRCLGAEMAESLERAAAAMEVTAPALLTWAWAQAVATAAGAPAVAIGQVRTEKRQDGCAGFSMTTVPLVASRAAAGPAGPVLRDFRKHLLEMRRVEAVALEELSPAIFHESGGPCPGGVVMIERGSLGHMSGQSAAVEAMTLHESSGEPLLASAWIRPDLRLEVETDGSCFGRHAADAAELVALPADLRQETREAIAGPVERRHLATAWRESAGKFADLPAIWTPAGGQPTRNSPRRSSTSRRGWRRTE